MFSAPRDIIGVRHEERADDGNGQKHENDGQADHRKRTLPKLAQSPPLPLPKTKERSPRRLGCRPDQGGNRAFRAHAWLTRGSSAP